MTLKPEHIRVNDIELANDIIWQMNKTAIKQAEQIRKLTEALQSIIIVQPCRDGADQVIIIARKALEATQ